MTREHTGAPHVRHPNPFTSPTGAGALVDLAADRDDHGVGLAGKGLSRGNAVAEQVIGIAIPLVAALGKGLGINLDTSIDNPGRIVQQWVDGDGVSSDAKPGIRVFGFGAEGGGSAPGSGPRLVGPWSG